jgi:glycosyltransferase involved in cell wall biosynthesis
LFSTSFPFIKGGESNFLNIEVKYLLKEFERVIVVPENYTGEIVADYAGAEVDVSFLEAFASLGLPDFLFLGLTSSIFHNGRNERNFPVASFAAWRRLIAFAGKAEFTRRWILKFLQKNNLTSMDCLFYTYWFDHAAAGIAAAKSQFPELKLVSRAHGYDVFEEQYYDPPFWPCRHTVLKSVDTVFSASSAGRNYFVDHYPEFSRLFETAFLGVQDPGFLNQPSMDGVFRIVSCSMIRPEKRVERMLDAVLHASKLRPDQRFEWTHIGTGLRREELQKLANNIFPSNAKAYFLEYSDNDALMQLYRDKPFDVFINISKTEGTPVSIMEAISCGIPVIATAVGGNVEIVSEENGIHLSQDPTLDEISAAMFYLIDHPTEAENKREESRHIWQTQYNAQINFSEFAKRLKSIRLAL